MDLQMLFTVFGIIFMSGLLGSGLILGVWAVVSCFKGKPKEIPYSTDKLHLKGYQPARLNKRPLAPNSPPKRR